MAVTLRDVGRRARGLSDDGVACHKRAGGSAGEERDSDKRTMGVRLTIERSMI